MIKNSSHSYQEGNRLTDGFGGSGKVVVVGSFTVGVTGVVTGIVTVVVTAVVITVFSFLSWLRKHFFLYSSVLLYFTEINDTLGSFY